MPKGPRSKEDRADPYAAPAREPHIVATGADFSVTPTFLGGTAGLLYGRKDGAVVLIDATSLPASSRIVAGGAGSVASELGSDPTGARVVHVARGEALYVSTLSRGRQHPAYRTTGPKSRLFGPRMLADGTIFVRERSPGRTRLLRIPPAGGGAESLLLPTGTLRAFEVTPEGDLWLGTVRRGQQVRVGDLHVDKGGATRPAWTPPVSMPPDAGLAALPPPPLLQARLLASLPRTLPAPQRACGGEAMLLVDESTPMARLARIALSTGAVTHLTAPHMRVREPGAFAVVCAP